MRRPLAVYLLESAGRLGLVPVLITGVLLPVGALAATRVADPMLGTLYIDTCLQLLLPAMAAWWPPFAFRERIEGDGRELLHLMHPRGESLTALSLAVAYVALCVPFAAVIWGQPSVTGESLALLTLRCLFMSALAFCSAAVLRSSALGLILSLLVNMLAMAPAESALAGVLGAERPELSTALFYTAAFALLLIAGEVRTRRFSS